MTPASWKSPFPRAPKARSGPAIFFGILSFTTGAIALDYNLAHDIELTDLLFNILGIIIGAFVLATEFSLAPRS